MGDAEAPMEAMTTSPSPHGRFYYRDGIPVLWFWLAFLSLGFSDTGPLFLVLMLFIFGCGGFLLFWAIRGVLTVASWVSNLRDPSVPLRPFRYFAFEPILVVLSFLYIGCGFPQWVRFKLSESALDAHAQAILDGRFEFEHVYDAEDVETDFRAWDTRSHFVGLYWIDETRWLKSGEILFETATPFINSTGLMYSTAANDEKFDELGWIFRWDHLSGPWWRYEEDF